MSKSKETSNSNSRFLSANENDFETPMNPTHYPPPRTPLNTIADPAQFHSDSHYSKLEPFRPPRRYSFSDRKLDYGGTPRDRVSASGRGPNSAQTTPSTSRIGTSISTGKIPTPSPRAISLVNSDSSLQLPPHFDLQENSSFWADHNVQVLIRIRPLSTMERVSQGQGRCLRQESAQTLVWLGHPETRFTFDHVACETISQESLFRVAGLPMVENCLSGYNSCMFAYGQTGSGKTYTMMGEMYDEIEFEGKLNEDSGAGLTPRIFEYLFKRIIAEEESRRDEQLKYSCKCSFLEIYNEQITDLLEPSSANLQLREDLKKGVYVENLTEYNVRNVNDVVKLLLQGAANRKVAATHMNSESSRSHSVFTCTIECRWGKDSMTHFRFARLNLVDLAGSERQKSSGAEGDRLKEAANINKSLSTLGLVMMSLVDLAHGKHRHVPYRDSRLTFLLQDSLGGNSKTTIIANISPSICSANETLSTLKFAQRAKLIQNNAKVNEDASGDINALQRQIQQLKGQLSFLLKHNYISKSLPSCVPSSEGSRFGDLSEGYDSPGERTEIDNEVIQRVQNKIKCVEATLVGALRREKMTETALQKLEGEFERMQCVARQREEDAQQTKMMLSFRDEEIKRLKLLTDGMLSAETYLVQENKILMEEIQLLRAGMDRNPELTQYAIDNNRIREELPMFQNFYGQGEREILLSEVSELRNQLLDMLEGKVPFSNNNEYQEKDVKKELEDCRRMNSKLIREVEELRTNLRKNLNCSQAASESVESMSLQSDVGDEMAVYIQTNDEALQTYIDKNVDTAPVMPSSVIEKELMDATLLTEAIEFEQVRLIIEKQHVHESHRYMEIFSNKDKSDGQSMLKLENKCLEFGDLDRQNNGLVTESSKEIDKMILQGSLDRMTKDLEEVRLLNSHLQEEQALQLSCQRKAELVCEQVEMETRKTILQLQEEVASLQCKLNEKLYYMTQENTKLRKIIATKEEEIKALNSEWERATLELTGFLVDGSRSLKNVSSQIESIACSFPRADVWISQHVERAARIYIEKEETILQQKKSLEEAQNMVIEMGQKLSSLKGVTLALTELQHLDNDEISKEEHMSMLLNDKLKMIKLLEKKLKVKEAQVIDAEKCASVAFIVINWVFESQKVAHGNETQSDISISTLAKMANYKTSEAFALEDVIAPVEMANIGAFEFDNAINAFNANIEMNMADLRTNIQDVYYTCKGEVQNLVKEIREMKQKYMELRDQCKSSKRCRVDAQSIEEYKYQKFENQYHMLHQIRDELKKMNCRLEVIEDFIHVEVNVFECSATDEGLIRADAWSLDSSSSSYDFLTESVGSRNEVLSKSPKKITEQIDLKFESPILQSSQQHLENPNMPLENLINNEATTNFLKKELKMLFDAFDLLHSKLAKLLNELNFEDCLDPKDLKQIFTSSGSTLEKANVDSNSARKVEADKKIDHARSFLSKFEEARATIKEADFMLNALMKANENAKQLTGAWQHTGEELLIERATLIEEVQQLKSSIRVKENENQLLHDQARYCLAEIASSMSLFEECFMQLKNDEDMLKAICSDVFSMGMETLQFISSSRSFLEEICFEIVEKDFSVFVLYQCYLGELINKIPTLNAETDFHLFGHQESYALKVNKLPTTCSTAGNTSTHSIDEGVQSEVNNNVEGDDMRLLNDDFQSENLALKKELKRKEVLLHGLHFDFSLLQESTSNSKDIKEEIENLVCSLTQVRHELETKTRELDEMLVQHKKLECHLTDTGKALAISNSDLAHANETIDIISEQNIELKMLLKDLYLKKIEVEKQFEEQREVVNSLEEEILQLTTTTEKKVLSLVEDIEDNLRRVTSEKDQLQEEVQSLNDKLEMAYALADEKEAIVVEARQESKASTMYAEQKEEEVKILERSIEELESTINVLEKKVYEMDDKVERHQLIRDALELELKALKQRLLTVENLTENGDSENANVEQTQNHMSRQLQNKALELNQAHAHIKLLEEERAEQEKELNQYKAHITELMLHAEAQSSQYQQKYKTLEAMVHEVKIDSMNSTSTVSTLNKTEKSLVRTRGSSSPFKCIASLVQQMNLEKDQELSTARLRIEELEALAASLQKEVCMLSTRLAAAESMTHDVIRDLLGVKLDMSNFANLMDQYQIKKLVEDAHQQIEDFMEKEEEIAHLQKQINDLSEERESCVLEINKREGDLLAAQISVEQLQERDCFLSTQNEMLKMDKTNLMKKVSELDEMVRSLLGTKSTQGRTQPTSLTKKTSLKLADADFTKRLQQSEKLLSRVNGELARYYKSPRDNSCGHGLGTSYRKHKAQVD